MPRRSEILWFTGLVAVSIGIHAAAVGAIGRGGSTRSWKAKGPTLVTMEVAPPKPPPPPEAPPAPKPVTHRLALARPARPAAAAPRQAAPPPPEAETPADFTGVTLTNNGPGPGWASAAGNGQAMTAPIGAPGAKVTGRDRAGATGGEGEASGSPVLKLADLSQPPRAPLLDDLLERNYPEDARKRGVQGQAVLRVRVMPDGRVRDLLVVAESVGGFGEACKRTLRSSVWSPPLDRQAHPVSTFVSYTCRFEVR